jgi:hypothetical protein
MRFRETIGPLALAPLAAVVVLAGLSLLQGGMWPLMVFAVPYCYAAEIVFVVPTFWLWPQLRTPGLAVAAVSGILIAWISVAFVLTSWRWQSDTMLPFGAAGAVSGLLYSHLVRSRARLELSN